MPEEEPEGDEPFELRPQGTPLDILYIREKIKHGHALRPAEKAFLTNVEKTPITIEELEDAENRILKQLARNVGALATKDLPKALDIIQAAKVERKARGGPETQAKREPTREEMLEALQGRRVHVKP